MNFKALIAALETIPSVKSSVAFLLSELASALGDSPIAEEMKTLIPVLANAVVAGDGAVAVSTASTASIPIEQAPASIPEVKEAQPEELSEPAPTSEPEPSPVTEEHS